MKIVWFIPDLKKKIYITGVITERCVQILKEAKLAKIYENEKLVDITRPTENNLYEMQIETVTGSINIAEVNYKRLDMQIRKLYVI